MVKCNACKRVHCPTKALVGRSLDVATAIALLKDKLGSTTQQTPWISNGGFCVSCDCVEIEHLKAEIVVLQQEVHDHAADSDDKALKLVESVQQVEALQANISLQLEKLDVCEAQILELNDTLCQQAGDAHTTKRSLSQLQTLIGTQLAHWKGGPAKAVRNASQRIQRLERSVAEWRGKYATSKLVNSDLKVITYLKSKFKGDTWFEQLKQKLNRAETARGTSDQKIKEMKDKIHRLEIEKDSLKNDVATARVDRARGEVYVQNKDQQQCALRSEVVDLTCELNKADADRNEALEELLVTKHEFSTLIKEVRRLEKVEALDTADVTFCDAEVHNQQPALEASIRATTESRVGRGNTFRYTNETISELFHIVDDFSLAGNRIGELFQRILQFWTGWADEKVLQEAPLPKPTQLKVHFQLMGRLKQKSWVGARAEHLMFFGAEADEGSMYRSKLMVVFGTFMPNEGDTPTRLLAGAKRISNTTAASEYRAVSDSFDNLGWSILHWLWFTGDSAASMTSAGELAQQAKVRVFAEQLRAPGYSYPSFLPADTLLVFLVNESQPDLLIPLHGPFYNHDACHIPQNGEGKHLMQLGAGCNMASGKLTTFKGELFRFSRLHKPSHECRDIMRQMCKDMDRLYKTIPPEINHRLKITTKLAELFDEFREPLADMLTRFNDAYGGSRWKGDRQPILDHMKEVMAATHDIRIIAWSKLFSKLHSWAEEVYSATQTNSGFNMCLARRVSHQLVEQMRAFDTDFDVIFQDEIKAILEACEEAGHSGALEYMGEFTIAQLNKPYRSATLGKAFHRHGNR
ncbi:hypothetical protein CYMTET_24174 [Cymbomonas tetramitiformis]|uniref:Uncharacterized protein n=1 Tax=Cymbomonas tetramitiformis TaxID=36881 RepID=A0AAE0L058_9CHLO|nr:hypothetical protein CYMTET_24174 [Cymbomonas tetramitiformis]